MTISVLATIGPRCSERVSEHGRKDGRYLREKIISALSSGDHVVIELTGVLVMTSSFADEAFGKLLNEFSAEELKKRLTLNQGNADPTIVRRIQASLRNRAEIKESEVNA